MSKKNKQKKHSKIEQRQEEVKSESSVKMVFSEDKFLVSAANRAEDMKIPKYKAGVVYEIAQENVARWVKRGGKVLTSEAQKVEEQNPVNEEPVESSDETSEDGIKAE